MIKQYTCLVLFLCTTFLFAQDIPTRPSPQRLVNDFANILSPQEKAILEQKLVTFNDSTSIQIAVVIVLTLNNYDPSQYAYELAQSWGIGQKGKNNGLVILIKPKTRESKGEVFIAVGYGLEGVIPDAIARRIVANEMIPNFKAGSYYGGIDAATNIIISLSKNEFTADQYSKKIKGKKSNISFLIVIIIFIIIIAVSNKNKNNSNHEHIGGAGSSLPWWLLLGGMSAGRGSFGDFSRGGGASGGSDFGGFGGGSFGGGGAGGSW